MEVRLSMFYRVVLSALLVCAIAVNGKCQKQDTAFMGKSVSDIRKMLVGSWVMVDDSTIKIKITADSIQYLKRNNNGIPEHRIRGNVYEITQTHCGASFVNSQTGFYVVEHTMRNGKQLDSCLPIQV